MIPERTLNSFGNLLLLCQAHHGPVDDRAKEDKYPKKLLLSWKKEREASAYGQLAGLDVLGKDDLEEMLVSAVADTKDEILEAIDELAVISKGTAVTLRTLVRESFDRPYLDLDAVALLADSAASLRHLPDSAGLLNSAAKQLENLGDSAAMLVGAASTLDEVANNASFLQAAASDLSSAVTSARSNSTADDVRQAKSEVEAASQQLAQVVEEIKTATHDATQAEYGGTIIQQVNDGRNWLYFKWGLGTGAVAVAALAILITIMVVQHSSA